MEQVRRFWWSYVACHGGESIVLNIRTCCWAILVSVLSTAACWAQGTESKPAAAPATSKPATFVPEQNDIVTGSTALRVKTMELDPQTGFPPGGPPYSLESPMEFYARPFAALNTGHGPLSDVLRPGIGTDVGVRSFLFNEERSAAWYGDLGVGYQYNDSHDSGNSIIVRTGTTTVSRLGSPVQLDSVTSIGISSLQRIQARLGLGREVYFRTNWFNGMCCAVGGDFGGVYGQATAKTIVNDRNITGLQPTDEVIANRDDFHTSQVTQGFYLGTSFNLIFPRRTYDFSIGSRFEWQQDYFNHLVPNNDGASQIKLMLELGWRF